MHTNVVECIMLSNDSGAHNVHTVDTNCQNLFEFCANVGVMFELSYL